MRPALYLLLTLFSVPALPNNVNLYAKTDIAYTYQHAGGEDSKFTNNDSTIGLRGRLKTPLGFNMIFKSEWHMDSVDISEGKLAAKLNYIGVTSKYGNFIAGHNEPLAKRAFAPLDQFNERHGDINILWQSELNIKDTVSYYSPHYDGYSMAFMTTADDAYHAASFQWGDSKLKSSNMYGSYSYSKHDNALTIQRITGSVRYNNFQLILAAQQEEIADQKDKGFIAAINYGIANAKLKAQYQTMEDFNVTSFGVDVFLTKHLMIYATNNNIDTAIKESFLSIGAQYRF